MRTYKYNDDMSRSAVVLCDKCKIKIGHTENSRESNTFPFGSIPAQKDEPFYIYIGNGMGQITTIDVCGDCAEKVKEDISKIFGDQKNNEKTKIN